MSLYRSYLQGHNLRVSRDGADGQYARALTWACAGLSFLVAAILLAGCGGDIGPITVEGPAAAPLAIPPLLEPSDKDGVAHYDLTIGKSRHEYQQGALTDTYSYNGMSVLGPTLLLRTGDPVVIGVTNELDEATTTHWHGADVPAEDDGGPHSIIEPGQTWVADFEVIQPAATLWYHPHAHGSTAKQVYRGAAGLLIIKDDNPAASALPATYGVDDIPVIIQDRDFTAEGQLDFAIDDDDAGKLYGVPTVNGTIDPFVLIPTGLVRLRLLNGSQARIYELSVRGADMTKIASDGGYLPSPVAIEQLVLAPGDRAEIVVDVGAESAALVDSGHGQVLELRPDMSVSGEQARFPTTSPQLSGYSSRRLRWTAGSTDDRLLATSGSSTQSWGINGVQFDMDRIDVKVQLGDTERWTLSGGARPARVPPPPDSVSDSVDQWRTSAAGGSRLGGLCAGEWSARGCYCRPI